MAASPSNAVKRRPAPSPPPCAFVIFGASGDLTRRLLIPALYNLAKERLLPDKFAVIGLDRVDKSAEAFREDLAEGVKRFVSDTAEEGSLGEPFDAAVWESLGRRMTRLSGDVAAPETYRQLAAALDLAERKEGTGGNAIFYLAVASPLFGEIVEGLGKAGLLREEAGRWRRVIIEKPFGRDLATARALNTRILDVLRETQVYRIDHFLGKETVQNIMALRFANGIFEPLWNRHHIDYVQISVAETVGVEHRAEFYEATGALRDMVPNHLFQLMSLTAMETPNSFAADAVRTEKRKVLEAVHPLDETAARRDAVRGQYGAGTIEGKPITAYRSTPGIKADSMAETYVALRLAIDNWRWAGVPFYLRTGKSLARRSTEIAIFFKMAPIRLFHGTAVGALRPNVLGLQIQPDEGICLEFEAKVPGPEISLGAVRMDFRYKDYFKIAPNTGYETLLYDAMIGDQMLFQRADSVEAGWAVVEPILDLWRSDKKVPLETYAAGSAGPESADLLLRKSGREWRPLS